MIDLESARQCRSIMRRDSKSFVLATSVLPRTIRNEVSVVYAWCRTVDDAVDDTHGAEQQENLDRIRSELDSVYALEDQTDVVLRSLQAVIKSRQIPKLYFNELVNGLEMDASGRRYETFQELLEYCFRVAGTVGLIMCHVLGVRTPIALRHAAHLGIAMQLSHICRDVREDWERGRLYIPAEILCNHEVGGISKATGSPITSEARESLAGAVKELLAAADLYYASGNEGIRYLTWRCALAVRTASEVHAHVGERVASTGYDVFAGSGTKPKADKLRVFARAVAWSIPALPNSSFIAGTPPHVPADFVVRFPDDVLPV